MEEGEVERERGGSRERGLDGNYTVCVPLTVYVLTVYSLCSANLHELETKVGYDSLLQAYRTIINYYNRHSNNISNYSSVTVISAATGKYSV